MPKTTPEQNKALVLKAFDTLFNQRDYAAAERLWSMTTSSTVRTLNRAVKAYSPDQVAPSHSKVRSRRDCRRGRLRDRVRPLFRVRSTGELDCG